MDAPMHQCVPAPWAFAPAGRFPSSIPPTLAWVPDLVIGCGRRSAGVALGIRSLAGPATRLVHLGRPRTGLDAFDLAGRNAVACAENASFTRVPQ
jgi:hypothetical protein